MDIPEFEPAASAYHTVQNRPVEMRFISTKPCVDPFNVLQLAAMVTEPDGDPLRVPGFWAGGNEWRIRYVSAKVGRHIYRIEGSDTDHGGLGGVTGHIDVAPYKGSNPLYVHGPLRVAQDRRHFEHADGTPFFWMGDTWWMGLCRRLQWPDEFKALTADRSAKGFTVIQIVAGLYPDMPPFDERGANEAGFPWEPEYRRLQPEYFDAADHRLEYLVESGLTPCIVGAWGYFLPWMGVEKAKQHWRYLVARYGALPVVWCIAGEANLPYYLTQGFPFDDREQVKGWTEVTRYVRQIDPFHRLLSIHPTGLGRLSARGATGDVSLLDFDMLQTGHGGRDVLPPTITTLRWSCAEHPTMPVLNSEVSYEALLNRIPADIQRLMFWTCMLSGAAGHTYGANGIWQVNRQGQPHGASPHGGNYGLIPWDEAMHLPGSTQVSLGKRLLEQYPWHRFEPHPEWASWADEQRPRPTDDSAEFEVPYAAGLPGLVRILYIPCREPIVVQELEPQTSYTATCFDPVNGERTHLGVVRAEASGAWRCPPPVVKEADWVLILERSPEGTDGLRTIRDGQYRLANDYLAWHVEWSQQGLRSSHWENRLSGHSLPLSTVQELVLRFSACKNRVTPPLLCVTDWKVREVTPIGSDQVVMELDSPSTGIAVSVHYQLEGPTRRKWVEVQNRSVKDLLLLDIGLDDFTVEASTSGGGQGQPVFVGEEAFAAMEHPAGVNERDQGRIQLMHFPGRRLSPGDRFRSRVALVSVAQAGQALEHFVSYIQEKSLRKKRMLSVYTPFGINNQWGACPTLDDEQTLDVLGVLENWQKKGVRFDYFTLDAGWVDPASDLTRFRPTCYPHGPGEIVERVNALGMKFGLWFATSWGTQSCWDYPPAYPDQGMPGLPYREGYPVTVGGITFCLGSEGYFRMLRDAILYHIRENNVRFIKLDGGSYGCDHTEHGHLPGKYSVEAMYENLIHIADRARALAPEVYVMWYWGLRSPFWALYGDSIFESGLHMEGSGTSSFPTLYYRDSVILAQDQNAHYARTLPPMVKDSLGVWLADTRWGNFMGKERWKEALVMDLGRGNLLFPNLWGNIYHFTEEDVKFLAQMSAWATQNEPLFLQRRTILGDPWKNEVYGYAYFQGAHGVVFLHNAHFASRKADLPLDSRLRLHATPDIPVHILSHFPERKRLLRGDGSPLHVGDRVDAWLRPFEVLMLEVMPSDQDIAAWPVRAISDEQAASLGVALPLEPVSLQDPMEVWFLDADRFEQQQYTKRSCSFESTLPSLEGEQPILAVTVQLRKGDAEWRHSPAVVEIVQVLARVNEQNVQLVPVPDGRQSGNTQNAGCSWVVCKTRLSPLWSRCSMKLAVHAYLPEGVYPHVEAWVVRRWWEENPRPLGDGYYTYAPS